MQIAKALGAHVTGVCNTAQLDVVRSIGAEDAIDYTQEDFVRLGPAMGPDRRDRRCASDR